MPSLLRTLFSRLCERFSFRLHLHSVFFISSSRRRSPVWASFSPVFSFFFFSKFTAFLSSLFGVCQLHITFVLVMLYTLSYSMAELTAAPERINVALWYTYTKDTAFANHVSNIHPPYGVVFAAWEVFYPFFSINKNYT